MLGRGREKSGKKNFEEKLKIEGKQEHGRCGKGNGEGERGGGGVLHICPVCVYSML